jgi:hypothetical protein
MRKLLTALFAGQAFLAFAQTNNFPTNGNAGIGTTSPNANLEIKSSSSPYQQIYLTTTRSFTSSRSWGIATNWTSEGDLSFLQSTTNTNGPSVTRLYVDVNGNVGIGSTNPQNKFQIGPNNQGFNGNDFVISNGTSGLQLAISNAAAYSTVYGNGDVAIQSGYGKWSLYGKADGTVGIGTNTPGAKLHVYHSATTAWQNAVNITSNNTQDHWPLVVTTNNKSNFSGLVSLSDNINLYLRKSDGTINAVINSSGPSCFNGGYVGIGTGGTAPVSALQVVQSSNTDWASFIQNTGGTGKGLRIQAASGDVTPALQVDDNNGTTRLLVRSDGNVGIGNTNPDAKLAVSGQVHAQEVKVSVAVPGPDYVFEKDYQLTSLEDIKTYIDQNKHLPEVPSAKEMEKNGVQLGEMNMLLLKKIEELTLYVIEQNKKLESQNNLIKEQNERISKLEKTK